ncbi:unnamed protein product [Phytophthora lilii]|uniref:Unnamed protein product n=1 Tax=Phytophthora lilii TaxID=2077276 RepID=A0A9W7CSX1_9STRA|nr:unnamed protein product [Phytophthora lilii]
MNYFERPIRAKRLKTRPYFYHVSRLDAESRPKYGYVIVTNEARDCLMVISDRANRETDPTKIAIVNWYPTLQAFLRKLDDAKIGEDNQMIAEARATYMRRKNPGMTMSEQQRNSRSILDDNFYQNVGSKVPAFKVDAVILDMMSKYRLTWFRHELRLKENRGERKIAKRDVDEMVNWMDTMESLVKVYEDIKRRAKDVPMTPYVLARFENFIKIFHETSQRVAFVGIRTPRSSSIQTGLTVPPRRPRRRAATPTPTSTDLVPVQQGRGLRGRGLKGAGTRGRPRGSGGDPYTSIQRKGKYYNLNDIQNSGLASAYIYKKLGSKIVRIPDLNNGVLNVCYPSRKKVGPSAKLAHRSVNFVDVQMAIQSVSLYASNFNIDAIAFANTTFKIEVPTAATTSTISVTLADGWYTYADINRNIQTALVSAGAYLIDSQGNNVFFIQIEKNSTYYACQVDCSPTPTALGTYTRPATGLYSSTGTGLPTTTRVPRLIIDNAAFGKVLGFSTGTYPAAASTQLSTC